MSAVGKITVNPPTGARTLNSRTAMFFYGIDNSGFAWHAWLGGPSVLCVRAPVQRAGLQSSGGTLGTCNGALQLDWNQFQQANTSALGKPWLLGQRIYVQAWYRDPNSTATTALGQPLFAGQVIQFQGWFRDPPASKSTSLSNALEVGICP